jgi:hypothetical protein
MLEMNGIYKHYKTGNNYKVLNIGRCSETLELMVIYQECYGFGAIWIRPLKMFIEILPDGIPRFKFIDVDV